MFSLFSLRREWIISNMSSFLKYNANKLIFKSHTVRLFYYLLRNACFIPFPSVSLSVHSEITHLSILLQTVGFVWNVVAMRNFYRWTEDTKLTIKRPGLTGNLWKRPTCQVCIAGFPLSTYSMVLFLTFFFLCVFRSRFLEFSHVSTSCSLGEHWATYAGAL